jgi:hypothetical protein
MKETAQQYTQRITANVEGKQPLAVQTATAKKLKLSALFVGGSRQGRERVLMRLGTSPTGISATCFRVCTSTTETERAPELEM